MLSLLGTLLFVFIYDAVIASYNKNNKGTRKRCLCVLSCRDSNPERQNQNLLCYHYTTAQTSARKRVQR